MIPLADASGQTFRRDGVAMTVQRTAALGPQTGEVTLTLTLGDGEDEGPVERVREPSGFEPDLVPDLVRNRLEFEDADGRPLACLVPFDPAPGHRSGPSDRDHAGSRLAEGWAARRSPEPAAWCPIKKSTHR